MTAEPISNEPPHLRELMAEAVDDAAGREPLPPAAMLAAVRAEAEAAGGPEWRSATADEQERIVWDAAVSRARRELREQELRAMGIDSGAFAEPEDRGLAVLSDVGAGEYVEDLIRPGRIVVWAAEEGAGKSYTVDGELGIRVAVAGGAVAGAWPVIRQGPVLVLSEMHPDDDYVREAEILKALDLERSALAGRYYRLPLMTAAGGPPALTVPAWRDWVTTWLRDHAALLLIVDTATGATQVDPWGTAIQAVYRDLRAMLEAYPELAVVLVLHLKKPQGRGDRRISDVLGEWGRWCDVVVLQEADGTTRTKLATHKRVRQQRRIVATRAAGLLIDPVDLDAEKGQKVHSDTVLAAIEAAPGLTYAELGAALGVSPDTASRYAKALGERVDTVRGLAKSGPGARARLFPVAASPQITAREAYGDDAATDAAGDGAPSASSPHRRSTYIGAAMARAETPAVSPGPDPEAEPVPETPVPSGEAQPVWDFDAPVCDVCGRRKRRVPGDEPRFVCTFPHRPVSAPVA